MMQEFESLDRHYGPRHGMSRSDIIEAHVRIGRRLHGAAVRAAFAALWRGLVRLGGILARLGGGDQRDATLRTAGLSPGSRSR
ncbi:MAG: hypothetical protein OHK0024_03880 [Thalassobaculales bacterium]